MGPDSDPRGTASTMPQEEWSPEEHPVPQWSVVTGSDLWSDGGPGDPSSAARPRPGARSNQPRAASTMRSLPVPRPARSGRPMAPVPGPPPDNQPDGAA